MQVGEVLSDGILMRLSGTLVNISLCLNTNNFPLVYAVLSGVVWLCVFVLSLCVCMCVCMFAHLSQLLRDTKG